METAMSLGVFEWAIVLWVAVGLASFSAWSVRVWAFSERPARFWVAPTSWLVWHCGAGLVWLAAALLLGAVFGIAAQAAWRLVAP